MTLASKENEIPELRKQNQIWKELHSAVRCRNYTGL